MVYPFDEIVSCAEKYKKETGRGIEMGVITTPARAAQAAAAKLVEIGARAIWKYAPVLLDVPSAVVYEEVKLSASFAILTNRLRRRDGNDLQ